MDASGYAFIFNNLTSLISNQTIMGTNESIFALWNQKTIY